MKQLSLLVLVALSVCGCTPSTVDNKKEIDYTKTVKYRNYACEDIEKELVRSCESFIELCKQEKDETAGAAAGFIVFGAVKTAGNPVEIERMEKEIKILQYEAKSKECSMSEHAKTLSIEAEKWRKRRADFKNTLKQALELG